jgi:hypothetical protein
MVSRLSHSQHPSIKHETIATTPRLIDVSNSFGFSLTTKQKSPTPVLSITPPGTARFKPCKAQSTSPHRAPGAKLGDLVSSLCMDPNSIYVSQVDANAILNIADSTSMHGSTAASGELHSSLTRILTIPEISEEVVGATLQVGSII